MRYRDVQKATFVMQEVVAIHSCQRAEDVGPDPNPIFQVRTRPELESKFISQSKSDIKNTTLKVKEFVLNRKKSFTHSQFHQQ